MTYAKLGLAIATAALVASAAPSADAETASVSVKRLVLAHGVEGHEPQDAVTTFKPSDDRVYAFLEIENPTRAKSGVNVVFVSPSGSAMAGIPLAVGDGPRFRTWAFTRKAHETGEWSVVIRDEGGHKVLAKQSFTVAK